MGLIYKADEEFGDILHAPTAHDQELGEEFYQILNSKIKHRERKEGIELRGLRRELL